MPSRANLNTYAPIDRRRPSDPGSTGPESGTMLFADVAGFTPMTERLARDVGHRRAAEELTRQLGAVWTPLISAVHDQRGSVVSVNGDAISCWFAGDDGRGAVTAALAMQAALATTLAGDTSLDPRIALKIALDAGTARRIVVGAPDVQRFDVIGGGLIDRVATAEKAARPGEVLAGSTVIDTLGDQITVASRQTLPDGGEVGVLTGFTGHSDRQPWPSMSGDQPMDTSWVPPAVARRVAEAGAAYLADLRHAVACFISFDGIDYDADPAAPAVLDRWITHVQVVVEHYDGAILQLGTGDKGSHMLITFGAPVAHEDDVDRAIAAALEICASVAAHDPVHDVRVGISRGLMRAGGYGAASRGVYTVMGRDANIAVRLMAQAQPGQILMAAHARAHARGQVVAGTVDVDLTLKGVDGPVRTIDVVGLRSPETTATAGGVIGRDAELATLSAAAGRLTAGQPSTVVIQGEAGIGKSSLIHDFMVRAAADGLRVVHGATHAMGQTTLYEVWTSLLRQVLGLPETGAVDALMQQIDAFGDAGDRALAPLLEPILQLGLADTEETSLLDPQSRAEMGRELAARLVAGIAAQAPLAVVLDDVHWLDSASWGLTLRVALTQSVLLVLGARPFGDAVPMEVQILGDGPTVTHMTLGPLEPDEVLALVARRLGVASLPDRVARLIAEQAEGNPFFSEELAFALRDSGVLTVRDGVCDVDVVALDDMALPDTLHGAITGRIDRLPGSQQVCIKVGSVIGRIFAVQILRETLPDGSVDDVVGDLRGLESRDLTSLVPAGDSGPAYRFRHAVTHEAAYDLLLHAQRRELHRGVAEWFERAAAAEDTQPFIAQLAFHWAQVAEGETEDLDLVRKALGHLHAAADEAFGRFASVELLAHVTTALRLLAQLPQGVDRDTMELGLQALLAFGWMTMRGYGDPSVENAYRRAEELSALVTDSVQLGYILYGIYSFHSSRGEYADAAALADRLVEVAEEFHSQSILAVGRQSHGIISFLAGDIATGLANLRDSYELAGGVPDSDFAPFGGGFQDVCAAWLGIAEAIAGRTTDGLRMFESGLASAGDRPYHRGFVLTFGMVPMFLRDIEATIARGQELAGIAGRFGFALLGSVANIHLGWARSQTDPGEDATTLIRQGLTMPRMARLDACMPWFLGLLADAQIMAGDHAAARESLQEANGFAETAGGSFFLPELQRYDALAMSGLGEAPEAIEAKFRASVDTSLKQGSALFTVRAATALAGHLHRQGRGAEARERLSSAIDAIDTSLDIPDVSDARTVLRQIG